MLTYKECLELLDDAVSILEDANDGESVQQMAKDWLAEYYRQSSRPANRKPKALSLNKELTRRYTQAKALVEKGLSVKDACLQANITRDQWNRRKNIETHGVSRPSDNGRQPV